MSKALFAEGGSPRLLAPTTTTRMANRMLCASRTVAGYLPRGVAGGPALDILLQLYVAEEEAGYPTAEALAPAGDPSAAVRDRWIGYLVQLGLAERRGNLLALTADGHAAVTDVIEAVFVAQRALD